MDNKTKINIGAILITIILCIIPELIQILKIEIIILFLVVKIMLKQEIKL